MPEHVPSALSTAILEFQANPPVIKKTSEGQAGNQKTKYADLVEVYSQVMPRLNALRIIWTCSPDMDGDRFVLRWELEHVPTGETKTGRYPLGMSDNPQQLGSRQSYATRYALLRVLGLAAENEDDDGAGTGVRSRPYAPGSQSVAQRQRVPAAPPRQPAPHAERGPAAPAAVTAEQHRHMHALWRELGYDGEISRTTRLAITGKIVGEPDLNSSSNLTHAQAEQVIAALRERKRQRAALAAGEPVGGVDDERQAEQ